MKMFKASTFGIDEIEVLRLTDNFAVLPEKGWNGKNRKESLASDYSWILPTREEAKARLLQYACRRLEQAERNLINARDLKTRIEAL